MSQQNFPLYMPDETPEPVRYPHSLFIRLAGVAVLWVAWSFLAMGALLTAAMMSSYRWRGFGGVALFFIAFWSLRLIGLHMRGYRNLTMVRTKPKVTKVQPVNLEKREQDMVETKYMEPIR